MEKYKEIQKTKQESVTKGYIIPSTRRVYNTPAGIMSRPHEMSFPKRKDNNFFGHLKVQTLF